MVNGNHLKVGHYWSTMPMWIWRAEYTFYGDIYIYGNIKEGMTVELRAIFRGELL